MKQTFLKPFFTTVLIAVLALQLYAQDNSKIINDITQLNPIPVSAIIAPTSTDEIANAIRTSTGPVSVGGGRYSMGGQTAIEKGVQIDMRSFNKILAFSKEDKEITVQAGITWRKIQEFIDPYDLSLKIMQTYANFTVGGSLSVNAHGRYIGKGPLILSVKEIKVVLASGEQVTASRKQNQEIFFAAIGGYGGIGVITEATLFLDKNMKVERSDKVLPLKSYKEYFFSHIRSDTSVVFHNADIYPNRYKKVREVSYHNTNKPVTVTSRLQPSDRSYKANRLVFKMISSWPGGKWMRQHLIDPILYRSNPVEWRNYEASYDVMELEPSSRKKSTYVLQEYFVPTDSFDVFYPRIRTILRENNVNVINVSIRHAKQDPGSMLAWARTEVFAFVLYYKQGTSQKDKDKVKTWTRQLIDAAIETGGTYYLPYQIHASQEQFSKAYPLAPRFFELKKRLDPENKFRNKLWEAYYKQ